MPKPSNPSLSSRVNLQNSAGITMRSPTRDRKIAKLHQPNFIAKPAGQFHMRGCFLTEAQKLSLAGFRSSRTYIPRGQAFQSRLSWAPQKPLKGLRNLKAANQTEIESAPSW